ncbi:hypothetical protein [Rhodanobacter sp. C06]|uniref:hypothetical protein n=1 Tax=Rhodanobacter sp. C06 TaxID=1945854 RepID=UPI00143C67CC|nr:hypothetical protein [Rhodanobacter sp. C06]
MSIIDVIVAPRIVRRRLAGWCTVGRHAWRILHGFSPFWGLSATSGANRFTFDRSEDSETRRKSMRVLSGAHLAFVRTGR